MKNSLILPFILILIGAIFVSCNEASVIDEMIDEADTLAISEDEITESEINDFLSDLPLLKKWVESHPEIEPKLLEYLEKFSNKIQKEEQLKEIFALREVLIAKMEEPLILYFEGGESDEAFYEELEELDNELASIGMLCIYAEGMMLALDRAEILTEEIEKIATGSYKLYLNFKQALANSQGGEYPFMNLSHNVDVVKLGESLMDKYPDSEYWTEIKDVFKVNIGFFTDFHIVKDGEMMDYFCSGLSIDYYPYASSKENFEEFVEKASNSKYAAVVKKILENPSEIGTSEGSFDIVYVVMTDVAKNHAELVEIIFNYLNSGVDIPHGLNLTEDGIEKLVIAYRFYTDLEKAEEALQTIKDFKPEARIIKVNVKNEIVNE